jgi:hypothetical protein
MRPREAQMPFALPIRTRQLDVLQAALEQQQQL